MPLARHLVVVLAAGLALLALPGAASGAVIPVTITEDLTNGGDGECSLFEAVEASKLNADDGGCDGTGAYGDDTVQLAGLQYQITDGQIALLSGFGELTIDGVPGSTVIHRFGLGVVHRLFSIETGAVVEFEGVRIENGHAPDGLAASVPGGDGADGQGGGCILSEGSLTLRDSVVRECQAGAGGAGATGSAGTAGGDGGHGGNGGPGGGIVALAGTLTLIDTEVAGNLAGNGGGGGAGGAGDNGGLGGNGGNAGSGGGISAAVPVEMIGGTLGNNTAGTGGAGGAGGAGDSTPGNGGTGGSGGPGGGAATDGNLIMEDVAVSSNHAGAGGAGGDGLNGGDGGAGGGGGGLATAVGDAQLEAVAVDGNHAGTGGDGGLSEIAPSQIGDGGSGGAGGGWSSEDQSRTELVDSTVAGNVAGAAGGGSTLAANQGGSGGGIRTENASLNVDRTTIAANSAGATGVAGVAGSGGGLSLSLAGMSMQHSAVTGNDAGDAGGEATAGDGGGIHADDIGEVGIHSSTIAENSAGTATNDDGFDGKGGGIMQADTDTVLFLVATTVAGNSVPAGGDGGGLFSAGEINLLSTIVAGNQAGTESYNCASGIVGQAFNLTSDNSCPGTVGDPKLGPLADNGGPTETMGLNAGSSALDQIPEAGPPADACPEFDQRGIERPLGGACDIGAFEGVLPSGGPGPGGPGAPAAKAAFGRSALIKLSLGAKTIKSRGPVAVVIANGNAFNVTGRLSATTTKPVASAAAKKKKKAKRISLKAKRFTVAGKRRKTVKLRLPAKLRRLLKRTGKLSLRVKVVVTDPSGNRRTVSRVVKLKLKKRKSKK